MSNIYQSKTAGASPTPAAPEQVLVSLGEIADSAREGLLALAVGTGLQVMYAMMDADVAGLAGPKGRHQPDRVAVRHGTGDGSVTLGGRRVAVRRPRVRATDGSGEVVVPSYELFAGTEVLGRMAMERMLAGLSTRRYRHGLEPVGEAVAAEAAATSRSALSRRFVAATEHALAELMGADLSTVDLVVVMVDGVHFAEHTCVVALGIGIDGTKHPLALVEGSTENATLVTDLLVGLRERGLDVTRPILAVLHGAFDPVPALLRVQVLRLEVGGRARAGGQRRVGGRFTTGGAPFARDSRAPACRQSCRAARILRAGSRFATSSRSKCPPTAVRIASADGPPTATGEGRVRRGRPTRHYSLLINSRPGRLSLRCV